MKYNFCKQEKHHVPAVSFHLHRGHALIESDVVSVGLCQTEHVTGRGHGCWCWIADCPVR